MTHQILIGDVRESLATLPERSVHCAITSPPYWGLRSYLPQGHTDKSQEIGSESTPEAFIETLVDVFRAVRRVLRDDGTLWVNLGDSYSGGGRGGDSGASTIQRGASNSKDASRGISAPIGLKPGDLCNMPHRVAAALQADGWFWRSTIIWAKRSPMPESLSGWRWIRCRVKVGRALAPQGGLSSWDMGELSHGPASGEYRGQEKTIPTWAPCPGCDKCQANGGYVLRRGKWRPTTSHEYLFLFSKCDRYFCDDEAVQEPATGGAHSRGHGLNPKAKSGVVGVEKQNGSFATQVNRLVETRNPRSVWTLSTEPYKQAHFATFPSELPRRCILAGTSAHCCEACGAPHAPIVEKDRVATRPGTDTKITGDRMNDGNRDAERHVAVTRVLGYRPTCDCDAPSVPAVVLDPFLGSGTTLQAARAMGRDGVGCELNAEYAALAEVRIATPPKWSLATKAKKPRRKVVGQKNLFD